MKNKAIYLSLIMCLMLSVGLVSASNTWSKSFTYAVFNSDTITSYTIETPFENRFAVKITNYLTYNDTTGTVQAKIRLNEAGGDYLEVLLQNAENDLFVWLNQGGVAVQIGSGKWTKGEPIILTLNSEGYLNVGNKTDPDGIVDDFALGSWTLDAVGGYGSANTATSGYVNVEISPYYGIGLDTEQYTNMILDIIPFVVTIAVIGALLGVITKLKPR